MKFSIIIPVYNSEKYLKECVDSVLKQKYKNFEIILVDDESKDSSPEICDEYAIQDDRIKVIHKQNGGTADSRNFGLRAANGDYITFMDNDDYWSDEYVLSEYYSLLSESHSDVLMFNTMEYWEKSKQFTLNNNFINRNEVCGQEKNTALANILKKGLLYRAVWAKVIKKDLIIENNLFFKPGIRNEDTYWTTILWFCGQTFDWCEKVFYVYRKETGSAQTDKKVTLKEIMDLQKICKEYILMGERLEDNEFKKVVMSYLAYPYAVLLAQTYDLDHSNREKILKDIQRFSYVLDFDFDPSVRKVKKLFHIFGYRITSYLLHLYLRYR